MADVTQILSQIESGDLAAAEQLLPLVYEELRKLATSRLAHEQPGQTLTATAVVHEAYLRLVNGKAQQWESRGHFFAAAAEAMRRILVDRARNKNRLKRGADRKRVDVDSIVVALNAPSDEILAIDAAPSELTVRYPDCAELVKLRFYAGMTQADAAKALNLPLRTADRSWAFARAWLRKRLQTDLE